MLIDELKVNSDPRLLWFINHTIGFRGASGQKVQMSCAAGNDSHGGGKSKDRFVTFGTDGPTDWLDAN